MNELALFAGAGGGILGGKLLGWRTVCAVEWEPYPASVLVARQNEKVLPSFPIWDDVQTFDGRPWRGVAQIISGGFPCQDISVAGKGDGLDGERSGMWREMARIIGEVQPQYAFVENSPMLTSRGLGRVLGDLSEMGFDAKWCVLGADSIGASHKRDRIWILATNTRGIGCDIWRSHREERYVLHDINGNASQDQSEREGWIGGSREISSNVANSNSRLCGGRGAIETSRNDSERKFYNSQSQQATYDIWSKTFGCGSFCREKNVGNSKSTGFTSCFKGQRKGESWGASIGSVQWWEIEPPLDRVVDGMADRVDRLKAIGNGQVPLCAATAWRILNV